MLFSSKSFALSYQEYYKENINSELSDGDNYTTITVQSQDFLYKPDLWNNSVNNASYLSLYKGLDPNISYGDNSLFSIAEAFNSNVFFVNYDYAYSSVILPKENYTELKNALESFGFEVFDSPKVSLYIDEAKASVGLPYVPLGQPLPLTGKNIKVAVLDTGLDNTHPDVQSVMLEWHDVTGDSPSSPMDRSGHGTFVASIIAGTGANSSGKYSGVAPDARLLIWRVSMNGKGDDINEGRVATALSQAANSSANIITMSLGKDNSSDLMCQGLDPNNLYRQWYDAIQTAISRNKVVIAAAGNNGPSYGTVAFPACIDGVIAVGAGIKKDYPNHEFVVNSGNDMHVRINLTTGGSSSVSTILLNNSQKGAFFQKAFQLSGSSNFEIKADEQYMDWCEKNSNGDLTATCTNKDTNIVTAVLDCQEDCRNHYIKSPNEICNLGFGNGWYATGIDCENIDIDHVSDGHYTRNFDMVWNDSLANEANGWCEDTGGKDWTLTCTQLSSKPNIKVIVGDCFGNCSKEGSPNQICGGLGSDWSAIGVDCEDITYSGSTDKTFNDNIGTWCEDGGHEDYSVTCTNSGSLKNQYKVKIVNCNGGDCKSEGTPDRICQNSYGNGWYSQSVNCEGIWISGSTQDITVRDFDVDLTISDANYANVYGLKDPNSFNDIFFGSFKTNDISIKGVSIFLASRGPPPQNPSLIKPDITAPGADICAARASGETLTAQTVSCRLSCINNNYISCTGTSAAAPVAAGFVALLEEAKPSATVTEIREALKRGAELKTSNQPNMIEGYGYVNMQKSVDKLTDCSLSQTYVDKGYADSITYPSQCSGYNYGSYSSANQMREYSWSDSNKDCVCGVRFDSYVNSVSVNGYTDGVANVSRSQNITVDVDVKNTGSNQQGWWYLGVEFWNVSDYNDFNTRDPKGRVSTYYSNKDGNGGCIINPDSSPIPGQCPTISKCSITSETNPDPNHYLSPGETIRVRCQVPASFYPASSGSQGIMFRIHERDSGQDAANNGNAGNDWWTDALSKVEPADIKVIVTNSCNCTGDINCDGIRDIYDAILLANNFGKRTTLGDLNGDNFVDIYDAILLANNFNKIC